MKKLKRFLLLLLISLSYACSVFAKPTEIICLIPAGFTGGVIVLYDQPDGITPETTADKTVLYRIPKDGFLKVKPALDKGMYRFRYYFVDERDKRTQIEYVHPEAYVRNPGDTTSKSLDSISEDEKNNGVFVMNHRRISFKVRGQKIILYNFIVGKPVDALTHYQRALDKIDEIDLELQKANP